MNLIEQLAQLKQLEQLEQEAHQRRQVADLLNRIVHALHDPTKRLGTGSRDTKTDKP